MPKIIHVASLLAGLALAGCQGVLDLGLGPTTAKTVIEAKSGDEALARIRSSHGLSLLSSDPVLERAAAQQAAYMAKSGRMEHTTGRGRDFASRVRENRIQGMAAENIARGRFDAGGLFTAWMNSSGHRRNMLDPRFSKFGLASAEAPGADGARYWALVLSE
ncbi:MAG: CAP domain-containing protein [Rhizobiaceae bacterium]|nr:CAP domain-containing protein [Rhizobiaceae bacterium]